MTRRWNQAETCSLFAFQDVMAGVIGVLFFVVLLVSLDIVREEESGGGGAGAGLAAGDIPPLRQEVEGLGVRQQALEKAIAQQSNWFNWLHGGRGDLMRIELENLQKQLKDLQQQIAAARQRLSGLRDRQKTDTDRLNQLKGDLANAKAAPHQPQKQPPRVIVTVDERPDALTPWLVEVSAAGFRIAPKDEAKAVREFLSSSPEQQRSDFLAWAVSQNTATHYFVLLIKPSGIKQGLILETLLKQRGFSIGRDLLPEPWVPF